MLNCIDLNKATVLDGEFLVETKDPSHPLCYWVFDIVCFNDRNVGNFSLLHRLQMVRSYITSPLNNAAKNDKLHLPFQIRYKPMYNLDQTIFVWNDVCDWLILLSFSSQPSSLFLPIITVDCSSSQSWKRWSDFYSHSRSLYGWSLSQVIEMEASPFEFCWF